MTRKSGPARTADAKKPETKVRETGGLLERARLELGDLPEIMNMVRLLVPVLPVASDVVPGDSILREAIGNSQLEY
jgi:hypothetical protein